MVAAKVKVISNLIENQQDFVSHRPQPRTLLTLTSLPKPYYLTTRRETVPRQEAENNSDSNQNHSDHSANKVWLGIWIVIIVIKCSVLACYFQQTCTCPCSSYFYVPIPNNNVVNPSSSSSSNVITRYHGYQSNDDEESVSLIMQQKESPASSSVSSSNSCTESE